MALIFLSMVTTVFCGDRVQTVPILAPNLESSATVSCIFIDRAFLVRLSHVKSEDAPPTS